MPTTSESTFSQMSQSSILADYLRGLRFRDLPPKVVDYTKLLVLDLFGAALAGKDSHEARNCLAAFELFGGMNGKSDLWGTGKKTNPAHAALYNGIAASALEIDDFGGVDHSGSVVIPAVVAAGQTLEHFSGKDMILSVVAGYEIGRRVLEACGGYRTHNNHAGWHSTGTCGSFAAAGGAAKAMGLSAENIVWALGLAGSFTGGTWAFSQDSAMSKRYHPGRAAETGVTAAALARSGFTGPSFVFESPWGGFFNTYAKEGAVPELLTRDLGKDYKILGSGIKPYASCRDTHSAIDAVLAAREALALTPGDLFEIIIQCRPETVQMVGSPDFPATRLAAQLSLSYCVAMAVARGRVFLGEFNSASFGDEAVKALFKKVRYRVSDELPLDSEPVVKVVTRAGQIFEKQVPFALGAFENPMTRHRVEEKFDASVEGVLSCSKRAELKDRILGLEDLETVDELTCA